MRLVSTVTSTRSAFLAQSLALGDQVVDLLLDRADDHRRIDQPGRPDDLLDEGALGALHLPRAGRGADERRLRAQRLPLLELQRPVVDRRGQAEAELGEDALAVEVAAEHAADLRHRDVALVDDQQRGLGEVLEQGGRRLARLAAGEVARVVLDAGAGAGRLHHLDVEHGALLQPLRFEQPAGAVELVEPLLEVGLYLLDGLLHRRPRRHVVAVGVDDDVRQRRRLLAGQRIELDDRFDLVAEHLDAPGLVLVVGREQVDGVAAHPEGAALEGVVVALVLLLDEAAQQGRCGRPSGPCAGGRSSTGSSPAGRCRRCRTPRPR